MILEVPNRYFREVNMLPKSIENSLEKDVNKNASKNVENEAKSGTRKCPGAQAKNWLETLLVVPRPMLALRGVLVAS